MKNKLPIAAIIGGVVGVIAGTLTASKSGKETRKNIKIDANRIKQKSIEAFDNTFQRTKKTLKSVRMNLENKKK